MAGQEQSPRIDGSSEASYLSSYAALLRDRSDRERAAFLTALYKVEAAARADHPTFSSPDEFIRIRLDSVHGMSYTDILERANELTTDRERRRAEIEQKGQDAYESLSEQERVWFTVTRLLLCIRDGGLPSYFYNGYSEHIVDCMKSLEVLDVAEMQELLRKMRGQFRNGEPTQLATLRAFFSSSNSQTKESEREIALAERVEEKLNEYAAKHGIV